MKSVVSQCSTRGCASVGIPASRVWHRIAGCALAILSTCWCLSSSPAAADVAFTPIKHSDYQTVYSDGSTAWPTSGLPYPISLTGVVINNPVDMLDYRNTAADPQWQVFVQAVNANDFGGTTLYMRKLIPWDPSQNYTDAEWSAETDRLNYAGLTPGSIPAIQRGDLIQVQARAPGLFYNGKYNVNEMHQKAPQYNFDITILQRGLTPAAASIQLSTLKDTNNNFLFDAQRQTGCEHYQSSLVHLDNLLLDDPNDWTLGGTVTVRQGNLTFSMMLGLDSALASLNPAALTTAPFSVTAILDQNDSSSPYTGGYYLWLTRASDLTVVPEPSSLALLVAGIATGLVMWRRRLSQE